VTGTPGKPDCPHCGGDGVVPVEEKEDFGAQKVLHPPSYRRCKCVLHLDIISNVDRGMPGLSKAPKVKESSLPEYREANLWITASKPWFTAHLRHVAIRQPPTWYFKVVSDVDLITAWLASAALKGQEILDPDAANVSLAHLTLVDLVTPPALLVIRLGVKAARNVAAPEVLLEALQYRAHLNLPTWLWDQPGYPLEEGHICYSPQVGDYLSDWKHLQVSASAPRAVPKGTGDYEDMSLPSPTRATLSAGGGGKAQAVKKRRDQK
jgi:hypothetical protein